MRKLTLKRKFSICECASRIYLYLQCEPAEATENFDGVTCKQVCRLKNGKSVEIEIPEEETVIFVASGTMCAKCKILAGTEDVKLTTKPVYNPAQGNPFIFYQ